MSIPRNEPCPCGSGKKFKKCCGGAALSLVAINPEVATANEVKRADMELHDLLTRYMRKHMGEAWFNGAFDMFMQEVEEGREAEEMALAVPWALFHCPANESLDSIAALMMRDSRARLTDIQLAVLRAQLQTRLSIWEITAVEPGVGIALTDRLTGATEFAHEVTASHAVSVHTSILARVVSVRDVAFIAGVHPQPLTPRFTERAVTSMRRYFRVRTRAVKAEKLLDPAAQINMVNVWRLLAELQRTPPEMTNTDGDQLAFITDRFDFAPSRRVAVIAALGTLAGAGPVIDDEQGTEIIISRPDTERSTKRETRAVTTGDTVIARIEILKSHLLVETNSIARADTIKAALTPALGTLARFRGRDEDDLQALMDDAREAQQSGVAAPVSEPSPEMDDVLRQFRQDYMQKWLDDGIPALGGITPRQAAADKQHHPALKALLRELEYHESQLPLAQRFDLAGLRKQLGM